MLDWLLSRIRTGPGTGPIGISVVVLGRLDRSFVQRILDEVPPTIWTFRFVEPRVNVNWHILHEWHRMPFPLEDRTMVIFSAADHPVEGVAGGAAGSRCSVAVFGTETEEVLSLRCWHELLHGLQGVESSDAMIESTAFRAFLASHYPRVETIFARDLERFRHDPRLQRLFYTMLTKAFAASTGRPLLSLPLSPAMN